MCDKNVHLRILAIVSRYSAVFGRSRMDLAPAHITATGVCPSSTKSADTSKRKERGKKKQDQII